MIKRILSVVILVVNVLLLVAILTTNNNNDKANIVLENKTSIAINTDMGSTENDIYTQKSHELLKKQEEILSIIDKKEWFLAYKSLIDEYSEWCDSPETIYDYYRDEDLQLLFSVVEAEVTGGDFDSKCNVASVIFNRLYHKKFGDSLSKILIKGQFSCISDGRYKKVEITEDTILACEFVWMIEDTTNGCLFFESGSKDIHSAYAKFQFEDSVGHKFYSEKN